MPRPVDVHSDPDLASPSCAQGLHAQGLEALIEFRGGDVVIDDNRLREWLAKEDEPELSKGVIQHRGQDPALDQFDVSHEGDMLDAEIPTMSAMRRRRSSAGLEEAPDIPLEELGQGTDAGSVAADMQNYIMKNHSHWRAVRHRVRCGLRFDVVANGGHLKLG